MKSLHTMQRTFVEAAKTLSYGWRAAKHMEAGRSIFSRDDKDNTKSLREAEMVVRRNNREFKACQGGSSNKGRGRAGRSTRWDNHPRKTPDQIGWALMVWTSKHLRTLPQMVAKKFNNCGKLLECFKCGNTSHLIAQCPKKQ